MANKRIEMKEPIKAGDTCRVIGGQGRNKSPNLGLTVTVRHRIHGACGMDHTTLGRIHRCSGEGIKQLADGGNYIVTGWADFSVKWLEKIDPEKITQSETTESDTTA